MAEKGETIEIRSILDCTHCKGKQGMIRNICTLKKLIMEVMDFQKISG